MRYRSMIEAIAVVAALSTTLSGAQAFDDAKYPDWRGQWNRFIVRGLPGQPSFDQTKPWGFGQEAPLTAEYKAVLEASLADQARGGQGNFTGYGCLAFGMPLMMNAFYPLEFVITPDTTYVLINHMDHGRRIFTDGRDWPKSFEPSYAGYSIGKWEDADGDGRNDTLVVETRGIKTPHSYDSSGIPFHSDGEGVIKERIYSDKDNPNVLHNEITSTDNALTRPWTVKRSYRRDSKPQPIWSESICSEDNRHVRIGEENYVLGADGRLMPVRKGQAAPDLRYFQTQR